MPLELPSQINTNGPVLQSPNNAKFVLDLESLEGLILPQELRMLETIGIEFIDFITVVIDDYARYDKFLGTGYFDATYTIHVAKFRNILKTRQRLDTRYTDEDLFQRFRRILYHFYYYVYEHIGVVLGKPPEFPLVKLNSYNLLPDGIYLDLDVDYFPLG